MDKIRSTARLSFRAMGWFDVPGRGKVVTTVSDRETENFEYLIGQEVEVDGVAYLCKGVEKHAIPRHFPGSPIALVVEPLEVPAERTSGGCPSADLLANAAALFTSLENDSAAFDTGFKAAVRAWLREYEKMIKAGGVG